MAYGALLVPLRSADTEATATTDPPASTKCGIAARRSNSGPVTLVRITSSQSSNDKSPTVPPRPMPALSTSPSSRP